MYEFFFSNVLIKAMQVPFLDHTYMLAFFENSIRKRSALDIKSNKQKHKALKIKEYEDFRRDRTIKLRHFYEFFSLLFDQKLFVPFSQFLSDDSLNDFQKALKNWLRRRELFTAQDKSLVGKNFLRMILL